MLRSLRLRSGVRSFDRVVVELEDSGRAPRINAIRLLDGSGGGAVAPVPGAELPGDSRDAVWATGVVKPFRQDSSYSFVALGGDAGDAFLVRSLRQELAQGDGVRVRLEDVFVGAPRIVEVKRVGWRDPRIAKKRRLEEGALPSKERGNARPAWTLTRPQRACVEALLRAIGLQSGQLVMTLCCGRLRWAWVKGMRCELLAPSFDCRSISPWAATASSTRDASHLCCRSSAASTRALPAGPEARSASRMRSRHARECDKVVVAFHP